MIGPGFVIESAGQLQEHAQILSPQIELLLRAAEVERLVFRELAVRVVPLVALPLRVRKPHIELPRVTSPRKPCEHLARVKLYRSRRRAGGSGDLGEGLQYLFRR